MIKFFKNFRKDDSGAVTVDWVVLTAAIAVLGTIVYSSIETGVSGLTETTATFMTEQTPDSYTAEEAAD